MSCFFLVVASTSKENFIYNAIQDIPGLSAVKPKAGLYIFPKIDRNMYRIDDDEQFVLNFLKQEKVLLVHGRGFNWKEPDHFRIVYLHVSMSWPKYRKR